LNGEVFAFVEGAFCAIKIDVPEGEIVIGEHHLHVMSIFLDGFELFLKPLAHALCHFNLYKFFIKYSH